MADLKQFAKIFVTLLVIGAVIGVNFLLFDKLEASVCEAANSDYAYSAGSCYTNSTLGTEVTLDSLEAMGEVKDGINLGVTLLGVIVLVVFIVPVIKQLMGIGKGM